MATKKKGPGRPKAGVDQKAAPTKIAVKKAAAPKTRKHWDGEKYVSVNI